MKFSDVRVIIVMHGRHRVIGKVLPAGVVVPELAIVIVRIRLGVAARWRIGIVIVGRPPVGVGQCRLDVRPERADVVACVGAFLLVHGAKLVQQLVGDHTEGL